MKNQQIVLLLLGGILAAVCMVAPVSAGLTISTQGDQILSRTGAASPVITVTDTGIPEDGTIIIDLSDLAWLVANGTITDANVEVSDDAAEAVWSRQGEFDGSYFTLTLTSAGGPTAAGETVTVTFTGAAGGNSAWHCDTGEVEIDLSATRTDTFETSDAIIFLIYVTPGFGGLSTEPGIPITTTDGATSMVITVTDEPVLEHDIIFLPVWDLNGYVEGDMLTTANVVVSDDAAAATWTGFVDADGMLTLTGVDGDTAVGEHVTVTFTGGGSSPWKAGSTGDILLTPLRMDNYASADFSFVINIPAGGGGLAIAPGGEITTTTGATSMAITVTGDPILQNGLITIPVSDLDGYVEGGKLTYTNVEISDDAAAATWTGIVDADGMLTLTADDGDTEAGETVTVTFTGAGPHSWKAGSTGAILLTASRSDSSASADFSFVINISPPAGYIVAADFSAAPTADIAPFTVTFTDTSAGLPTAWDWDWGDGTAHGTTKNPSHFYADPGTYTVRLTASNDYTSDTRTRYQYIAALNGGITEADTLIAGLTVINCGGPQTVIVDTSVLPADLIPDKFTLAIQPPPDRGLKNITFTAQNGIGFTRSGTFISGNPTSVHLESEDIAPPSGFSNILGTQSSFGYSMDLPSYPCNAVISTKIHEGILPGDDISLQKIASGQNPVAVSIGTAYTATITRTNLPATVPVKLRISINSSWNSIDGPLSGGPGTIFLWRIADDRNSGQILPTTYLSTDPVNNLDYYEAESPLGMSTFGLSSFTGNNNPFQLITFALSPYIEPLDIGPQAPYVPEEGDDGPAVAPFMPPAAAPQATPTRIMIMLSSLPEPVTMNLNTGADGMIGQAASITSPDGFVTVSTGTGVAAKDRDGMALSSLTLTPVAAGDLPGPLPGGAFTFTGRAYELQPDGAVFSPDISLIFATPGGTPSGQDFLIKSYDRTTGSWRDVPTSHDPPGGTINGQVSRSGIYALFERTGSAEPSAAGTNMPSQSAVTTAAAAEPMTAVSIFMGICQWIGENVIMVAVVIIVIAGFVIYERKQQRGS
jgi:PKD repeat protein